MGDSGEEGPRRRGGVRGRRRRTRVDPVLAAAGIATPLSSAERSVVGVTTSLCGVGRGGRDPSWGSDPYDAAAACYTGLLQELGGVPVLLPPVDAVDAVRRHSELLDALVLSDGPRLHPNLSGGPGTSAPIEYDHRKDRYEWLLLDKVIEAGKPVLGVGRGLVVLNAFFGGTLAAPTAEEPDGSGAEKRVQLTVTPGTLLSDVLRSEKIAVRRADAGRARIERLGDGLIAAAFDEDGAAQAVESADLPFAMAVGFGIEWAREEDAPGRRLMAALLRAAAEVRGPEQGRGAGAS